MTKTIKSWIVAVSITVREKIAVAEEGVEAILQEVVGIIMGLHRSQPTMRGIMCWVVSIHIRHPSTTTNITTTTMISHEFMIAGR